MLSLHYHELIVKNENHEPKKYLMVNDCMLDKALNKFKEIIGIEKVDDLKTLIETNYKLPDDITFKNVVILMTCIIKDDNKFYPLRFLEEALLEA